MGEKLRPQPPEGTSERRKKDHGPAKRSLVKRLIPRNRFGALPTPDLRPRSILRKDKELTKQQDAASNRRFQEEMRGGSTYNKLREILNVRKGDIIQIAPERITSSGPSTKIWVAISSKRGQREKNCFSRYRARS